LHRFRFPRRLPFIAAALLICASLHAQGPQEQGHSIGTVTTQGNLVVLELNENALGKANLFDLDHRTLQFTLAGSGYKVRTLPLKWDAEFGEELKGHQVTLQHFAFPFSGKKWNSFSVGTTGAITFGESHEGPMLAATGFPIARFDQLHNAASAITNTVPGICVFLKPRMSGAHYVKELADSVVVTWNLTEPWGNIQDFTWQPTVSRFQVVLAKDGSITMSYDQVAAHDAIVGVYPMIDTGAEKPLATFAAEAKAAAAPNLDIEKLKIAAVDGTFLKVTFETKGPVLPENDPSLPGVTYRVYFDSEESDNTTAPNDENRVVWTIRGIGRQARNGAPGNTRYVAFGPGVGHEVKTQGNAISIQGLLPTRFKDAHRIFVSADSTAPHSDTAAAVVSAHAVVLSGLRSAEVDFSSIKPNDGPFKIAYEAFHYLALPNARDLSCTVINALGDKFDFLAYYSDFRIDNQEAGTPSNGPMGGHVTGIGQTEHGLESYCSAGRFQWGFIQPVYVGANQMQDRPPAGVKTGNSHDIDFYEQQLGEQSADGKMSAYNLAMSQIGHEMGHRWSAFVSAKVNGEIIQLGPTHWARGLQAPVAFPYRRPVEASAMGGGVWQDNFDGTFTQLDDDYYVPATGYSYLDLYLMGLITPAEVPDFFLLRNLVPAGRDSLGHPIFKADRVKVTIDDVIAVEGPRTPAVAQSQRNFNTGMVVVVEHGAKPSNELLERTEAIGKAWIDYFATVTGHRATMTTNPH